MSILQWINQYTAELNLAVDQVQQAQNLIETETKSLNSERGTRAQTSSLRFAFFHLLRAQQAVDRPLPRWTLSSLDQRLQPDAPQLVELSLDCDGAFVLSPRRNTVDVDLISFDDVYTSLHVSGTKLTHVCVLLLIQ